MASIYDQIDPGCMHEGVTLCVAMFFMRNAISSASVRRSFDVIGSSAGVLI